MEKNWLTEVWRTSKTTAQAINRKVCLPSWFGSTFTQNQKWSGGAMWRLLRIPTSCYHSKIFSTSSLLQLFHHKPSTGKWKVSHDTCSSTSFSAETFTPKYTCNW